MYCNGNNLRGPSQYDENANRAWTALKQVEFERMRKSLLLKILRVVPNQKFTYEGDFLLRSLSTDKAVHYSNHIGKEHYLRQREFHEECQSGELTVAVVPTGLNLHLLFAGDRASASSQEISENGCDFYKEPGRVHITSSFIMNGVCVKFKGWFDLPSLEGMGRLEFDHLNAVKEHNKVYGTQSETQHVKANQLVIQK